VVGVTSNEGFLICYDMILNNGAIRGFCNEVECLGSGQSSH